MSRICIKNGDVILPNAILKNSAVLIEGRKIKAVGSRAGSFENAEVINAKGCFVSSGFIDTHIHGSPETIFKNEVKCGTTAIVIAESCASANEIFEKIRKIETFSKKNVLGRNILGVRLEGPYISKKKAGAQDERYIKTPDLKEALRTVKKCGPLLKIMTIAPEMEGAIPVIRLLKRNNIITSIGHSNATYEETLSGIDAGIDHATHIFNAMRGVDAQDPGASTAVLLADAVRAEVILDLIHVRKALFDILIKLKGIGNTILVTDSVRAEKRPDVKKREGIYRFKDGRIAGSDLTMIGALENAVKECGLPLADAVKMLTVNPALLMRVGKTKGKIACGMDADIVIFDKEFDVKATIINGKIVYRKKAIKR